MAQPSEPVRETPVMADDVIELYPDEPATEPPQSEKNDDNLQKARMYRITTHLILWRRHHCCQRITNRKVRKHQRPSDMTKLEFHPATVYRQLHCPLIQGLSKAEINLLIIHTTTSYTS